MSWISRAAMALAAVSGSPAFSGRGGEGNFRPQPEVFYDFATDDEALDAFSKLSRWEGIIPALESAHGIAGVIKGAPKINAACFCRLNRLQRAATTGSDEN